MKIYTLNNTKYAVHNNVVYEIYYEEECGYPIECVAEKNMAMAYGRKISRMLNLNRTLHLKKYKNIVYYLVEMVDKKFYPCLNVS